MKRLLFVCTGNICRSPMAQYLLRLMLDEEGARDYCLESAGVSAVEGLPATDKVITLLSQEGIDCEKHRSKPLTRELAAASDLILVMTTKHREQVLGICPGSQVYNLREYALQEELAGQRKNLQELKTALAEGEIAEEKKEEVLRLEQELFQLDIADPYGGSLGVYEECMEEIRFCLEKMMERIREGSL